MAAKTKISINFDIVEKGSQKVIDGLNGISESLNKAGQAQGSLFKISQELRGIVGENTKLGKGLNVFNKLSTQAKAVQSTLGKMTDGVRNFVSRYQQLKKDIDQVSFSKSTISVMKEQKSTLSRALGGVGNYKKKLEEAETSAKNFDQGLKKMGITARDSSSILAQLQAGAASLGTSLGGIASMGAVAVAGFAALAVGAVAVIGAFVAIKVAIKAAQIVLKLWTQTTQGMIQAAQKLRQAFQKALDGIRQFTQGILSVGRALTFFVSIPITAFLKEATQQSMDFAAQLVRVQKVLGGVSASGAKMAELKGYILDIAQVSMSSQEELAGYAEQLGQLGVKDIKYIKRLMPLIDMFAQATDVGAEDAAFSLGKIANAFNMTLGATGDVMDQSISFISRMAEAINFLENNTGTSAKYIVQSLQDVGNQMAFLKADPAVIASWIALGQEFGMSAGEVGTALRNLAGYLGRYADRVVQATSMQGTWASSTEFLTDLNNNFTDTVITMVEALADNEAGVTSLVDAMDIATNRSGRFLVTLASSAKTLTGATDEFGNEETKLRAIVNGAVDAFENGGSLLNEYTILLNSVTGKTQTLKNTFKTLGLTIGNDVLPVIADAAGKLAPFITALSKMFAGLNSQTKRFILGGVALLAVLGPLSFFFSQVAFGLTLAAQGFFKILSVIPATFGMITALAKGLLTLNPIAILVVAAIWFTFNSFKDGVTGIANFVSSVVKGFTGMFTKWGKNVMDAYADGVEAASGRVAQAVMNIVNIIVGFLKAFSPPKEGPLSSIDMWGKNLMNTWLQSFLEADFSVLSEIGGIVENVLNNLNFDPLAGDSGDAAARKKTLKTVIKFREQFSELLATFRTTGNVTEEMLDNLVEGLGSAADEVKGLIKLELKYEKIQKHLRDIEKQRTDVTDSYNQQAEAIRLSGMSAEQMVEAMGQEQYIRDEKLRLLNQEEEATNIESEQVKEQIDLQKAMLGALQDQSDLWKELLQNIQDALSGLGDQEINVDVGGFDPSGLDDMSSAINDLNSRLRDLNIKAYKARVMLTTLALIARRLFLLITGKLKPGNFLDGLQEEIKNAVGLTDWLSGQLGDMLVDLDWEGILADNNPGEALRQALLDAGLTEQDMYAFFAPFMESGNMQDIFANVDLLKQLGITDPAMQKQVEEAFNQMFAPLAGLGEDNDIFGYLGNNNIVSKLFGDEGTIGTLATQIGILATNAGILLAPFTSSVATNAKLFWDAIKGGFEGIPVDGNTKLERIGTAIGQLGGAVREYGPDIIGNLGEAAAKIVIFVGILLGVDPSQGDPFAQLGKKLVEITGNISKNVIPVMTELIIKLLRIAEALEIAGKIISVGPPQLSPEYMKGMLQAGEDIKNINDKYDGLVLDTINAGLIAQDTFDTWTTSANDTASDLGGSFSEISTSMNDVTTDITTLKDTSQTAFDSFLENVQNNVIAKLEEADGMTNDLTTSLSALNGMTVETYIEVFKTNHIQNLYTTGTYGSGSGSGGGGGGNISQAGGIVRPGMLTSINEGGVETFAPLIPGKITSHGLSRVLMSGLEDVAESGNQQPVVVQVNNPVIREDRDIGRLAKQVASRIADNAKKSRAYGG